MFEAQQFALDANATAAFATNAEHVDIQTQWANYGIHIQRDTHIYNVLNSLTMACNSQI